MSDPWATLRAWTAQDLNEFHRRNTAHLLADADALLQSVREWERFEDALKTTGGIDTDYIWEQLLDGRPELPERLLRAEEEQT